MADAVNAYITRIPVGWYRAETDLPSVASFNIGFAHFVRKGDRYFVIMAVAL